MGRGNVRPVSAVRKGDLRSVRVFNDRTKFAYPRYGEWKVIWFGDGIIALDEKSFTDSKLAHDILIRSQIPRRVVIMKESVFNQKKEKFICERCGFPTSERNCWLGFNSISTVRKCLVCGKEVSEDESGV